MEKHPQSLGGGDGRGRARGIAFAATFAALTAAIASFSIPLILTPVPLTLQVFFVLLAGTLGGTVYGTLSMIMYLAAGVAGLPVFSGFQAGVGHLLGPTGGYLFAFPIAALISGLVVGKPSSNMRKDFYRVVASMLCALVAIHTVGITWLSLYLSIPLSQAFLLGGVFIPVDLIKLAVAAPVAVRLRKSLASMLTG